MSYEHPYPDYAYLEVDLDTNEKRWFGTKGMGVGYVHEDRVAEDVAAAVAVERERCAKIADDYSKQAASERWHGENIAGRTAAAVARMIRSADAEWSI